MSRRRWTSGSETHVSYHLKKLRKLRLVERVETPRGLGTWKTVNPKRQAAITSTMLALCNAEIAEAVIADTINEEDSHITRTPMIVDRQSYRELVDLLDLSSPKCS